MLGPAALPATPPGGFPPPATPVPPAGELLKAATGNMGKWGPDDEVGALNYLGTAEVLAAAGLIRSGKVFTLQRLIGDPKGDPVWPGRTAAVRTQIMDESTWDGDDAPAFPGGLQLGESLLSVHRSLHLVWIWERAKAIAARRVGDEGFRSGPFP